MSRWLEKFESYRSFTPDEAWKIFRITALGEACGWTILISGLLIHHYRLLGSTIAIPIAGQIHGTIFIAYFIALIFVYPSLAWSRSKTLLAFIAGVPPYGSLIFELWASKENKKMMIQRDYVCAVIKKGTRLMAMQPSHGINWEFPGGPIGDKETPQIAISRILLEVFNRKVALKRIGSTGSDGKSTYYYLVERPSEFYKMDLVKAAQKAQLVDEFYFVDRKEAPKLFKILNDL